MCFAGHCGAKITLTEGDPLAQLFCEEAGIVFQVHQNSQARVYEVFVKHGVADVLVNIGTVQSDKRIDVTANGESVYEAGLSSLRGRWWETSYQLQRLRDNPRSAEQEFALQQQDDDAGINPVLTFSPADNIISYEGTRPRVQINM